MRGAGLTGHKGPPEHYATHGFHRVSRSRDTGFGAEARYDGASKLRGSLWLLLSEQMVGGRWEVGGRRKEKDTSGGHCFIQRKQENGLGEVAAVGVVRIG